MRLALYQPDIAQNTGTILRLCACLGVPVDVIGPTGFDMSDRALKRAALDYLAHVDLTRHQSFEAFMQSRGAAGMHSQNSAGAEHGRLILLSAHAETAALRLCLWPGRHFAAWSRKCGLPGGGA